MQNILDLQSNTQLGGNKMKKAPFVDQTSVFQGSCNDYMAL